MKQAGQMIAGLNSDYVIADKAYDADHLMEAIRPAGGQSVIPPPQAASKSVARL